MIMSQAADVQDDDDEEASPEEAADTDSDEESTPSAPDEEESADASPDISSTPVEQAIDEGPAPIGHKMYPVSTGPAPTPADNTIVVTGQKKQDLDNEDALYAQDLARGHIKQETYQSLYANKDTLGKIGTLFGLLVSGAGSGLTGQPNAVLQMMDNQIKNDMEAQQHSNENAQNWLRLSQAHQRQKAEIAQMGANTENLRAQTGKVPSEIKHNEAAADLEATQAALNRARMSAAGYIENKVIKPMPPGPAKDAAISSLQNQVIPSIQAENASGNAQTAAKIGMISALANRGGAAKAGGNEVQKVDTGKIQALAQRAMQAESLGVAPPAGTIPTAQKPAVMKEAGFVNQNREAYKVIKNAFEKMDAQALGGTLNPENHKVIMSHVVGQLVSSGIPKDEAHDLASSMLPGWKDVGQTRSTKAEQMWEQFKTKESDTPNLDAFPGLKPPFPGPPKVSAPKGAKGSPKQLPSKAAAPQGNSDGQTGTTASGRPFVWRGGKQFYTDKK